MTNAATLWFTQKNSIPLHLICSILFLVSLHLYLFLGGRVLYQWVSFSLRGQLPEPFVSQLPVDAILLPVGALAQAHILLTRAANIIN